MRKYIIGVIVGATLLGVIVGHSVREYFPPVTVTIQRYSYPNYNPDSFYGRLGSAVAGGTVGIFSGAVLALLLEHYLNRNKN